MNNRNVGRPPINNARDYRLPEARLTKDELRMIKLKAQMYAKGNVSKYVRDLIEMDTRPYPPAFESCSTCTGKLISELINMVHYYSVADTEHQINITNFPVSKCKECNTELIDIGLAAEVEKILDELIHERLNHKNTNLRFVIPLEIDFNELLSPLSYDEKEIDSVIESLNEIGMPTERGERVPVNGRFDGIVGTRREKLVINIPTSTNNN